MYRLGLFCFHALFLMIFLPLSSAQESDSTDYTMALQRIEEIRDEQLTSLNLSRLGLTGLPPELWESGLEIRVLYLNDNNLSQLPSELASMSSLITLVLTNNQLQDIPLEITQMSNLRGLYLGGNQLQSIPPEIANLNQLEWLELWDNELHALPSEIGNLGKLCHLSFEDNQIRHLPVQLGQLSNLLYSSSCYGGIPRSPGFYYENNPLITPPHEIHSQGAEVIFDYLNKQAWWHFQRLVTGIGLALSILLLCLLGLARYYRLQRPEKNKRM